MPVCPPRYVEVGPPQPRRFGLYSVAPPTDDDRMGACGVEYQTLCGTAREAPDPCPPDESPDESPDEGKIPTGPSDVAAPGFPVYTLYECRPVGEDEATARQRATSLLELTEERAVEAHLWSDLLNPSPDPDESPADVCTLLASACEDVCYAVGAVEAWLGQNLPGQGVIHVPLILQPLLADGNMLIRNANRLETPYGTPIVLGAGYTTNPDEPNTATIFGTGPVHVYRGSVDTVVAFNHRTNERSVLAERAASVSHECGCVSALVTVCEEES